MIEGILLWGNPGIQVCFNITSPFPYNSNLGYIGMTKDNYGGVIISFVQQNFVGDPIQFKLQHYNSNGIRQYGLGGIPISISGFPSHIKLMMIDYDKYIHLFNIGGQSKIERRNINGELIFEQFLGNRYSQLVYNDNFIYLTHLLPNYETETNSDYFLHLNKIDENGNQIWGPSGIFIDEVYNYPKHIIIANADNSISISWGNYLEIDNEEPINNLKYQIIEEDGTNRFELPLIINSENNPAKLGNIIKSINQNIFVWYENRGNGYELWTQKYSLNGTKFWGENGIFLSNFYDEKTYSIKDKRNGIVTIFPNSDTNQLNGLQLSYFGNLGEILIPGDISNDETVNVIDVLQTIEICILLDNPLDSCNISDLYQDDEINVQDILLMVQLILGET